MMHALDDEFFRALERQRTQALVALDTNAARRLHAPGYQLITPSGAIYSLDAYLEALTTGALRYSKWDAGPMEVRQSTALAIVRYQARIEFPSGNVLSCWHTDSYELTDGCWKAIWSQATAIKLPSAVVLEP